MKLAAVLLMAGAVFGANTLYRQSAAALLASHELGPQVNYVVLDVGSGQVAAAQWPSPDMPVSVGSLVKPFLAAAHEGPYPRVQCDRSQCWKNHGSVGLTEALAYSCNSYFLQLLHDVTPDELNPGLQSMGLPAIPSNASARTMIGLDGQWRVTPETLLRAFGRLGAPVREGLELAARSGTMKAARQPEVWGKTGTAACTHHPREQGDGFALLWSAEWAVLVRMHNTTGANAAPIAGEILRLLRGMP